MYKQQGCSHPHFLFCLPSTHIQLMDVSFKKIKMKKRCVQMIFTQSSLPILLVSLLLVMSPVISHAVELNYYYGGKSYTSLSTAEEAMRTAHIDDKFDPREDALARNRIEIDNVNDYVKLHYKINLPDQAAANFDKKYWHLSTIPSYKEYAGIKSSEEDLIADLLAYQNSISTGYHCEYPEFIGFEENTLATSTRGRNLEKFGIYYPPTINTGRLFYDRLPTISWFIQHGWTSPQSGLCCTVCGTNGGEPIDVEDYHGGTTEYEVYICPEGYILDSEYLNYQDLKICTLVQIDDFIRKQVKYSLTVPNQCPTTKDGNPCDAATGNKYQTETDYTLANGSLKVLRHYSSQGLGGGFNNLGPRWRHNYAARMNGYRAPDYDNYQGLKSSFYDQANVACSDGWNEIKGRVYGGLLVNSYAIYREKICKIIYQGKTVMHLPINNTHDSHPVFGSYSSLQTFHRANGIHLTFNLSSGKWVTLTPSANQLIETETGWRLTASNGTIENYDSEGRLVSSHSSNGLVTHFSYNESGDLSTVTGHFGDTLNYHYNTSGRLIGISTPDGELGYSYDGQGRLVSVTYPDNASRQYHYEDPRFPYHLTGITDEKGDRYATWAYDAEGRAILSEHAAGAEQVELVYNPDGTTTVTDAVGSERNYHFIVKQGGIKVDHIEGHRCTTCSSGSTQAYTYDTNGFVASKTDWNGNVTTYIRDFQGRELSRTESSGTPDARTVTTAWDTTLNKPLVITEPDRITEYTYDANGRKLSTNQRSRP
ncbi:MAG: DUF6531 domain-containing protein [Candidatus Thiodiazotropha sp.]